MPEIVSSQPDNAVWPVGIDDVPDWVLRAERRRAEIGVMQPLPYRTKRQYEASLAAALRVLDASRPRKVEPDDAAAGFVAHVRGDAPVVLSNEALAALYRTYCAERGIECPDNFFRAALKLTPGARREETVSYKPRRVREVTWVIDPAPVSSGNRMVSAA